jgi:phage FluMu gp28-like protein
MFIQVRRLRQRGVRCPKFLVDLREWLDRSSVLGMCETVRRVVIEAWRAGGAVLLAVDAGRSLCIVMRRRA